ncbi:hypothetical protein CRG98_020104 [Punica granatum]|uniref:Uncharacterized protein n=1 Tax=Punica granatum TaxID=22663 RepID=A0A2I0JUC2_PUNGR|nr:hypothetical protein CRG98_020104 [Punica granatum]
MASASFTMWWWPVSRNRRGGDFIIGLHHSEFLERSRWWAYLGHRRPYKIANGPRIANDLNIDGGGRQRFPLPLS